ncbi:ATP-binding protein [Tautonia sp. JC769]|uniref:ATP-binding protein n=1 Tax=Tautonia sp. JC769 TaxID=3232135 RepID=UPI003459CB69
MDRRIDSARGATDCDRAGSGPEASVLPSRIDARSACLRSLRQGRGPVLLTGEAGAGKTWLCRNLAGSLPELGRWLFVDASPSDSGLDLLRRVLRGLGRRDAATVLDPRAELLDELAEQTEDSRRWVVVLDEGQNASDAVLEEFRLLANRLGQADGVAGLVLIGRTGLALRLRGRSWESLQARLALHAPLGPVDAEEARTLLEWSLPDHSWTLETIETLHARAAGNPARLLRLADRLAPAVRPEPTPRAARLASPPAAATAPISGSPPDRESTPPRTGSPRLSPFVRPPGPIVAEAPPIPDAPRCDPPRLGEARPPLRFEDGVIEVGWADAEDPSADPDLGPFTEVDAEADLDAESDVILAPIDLAESLDDALEIGLHAPSAPAGADRRPIEPSTVAIDDPYAAIQAQLQWALALEAARGLNGTPAGGLAAHDPTRDPRIPCACEGEAAPQDDAREGLDWSSARPSAQVRAESGQEFAPYSRLFSQLNSANEPE